MLLMPTLLSRKTISDDAIETFRLCCMAWRCGNLDHDNLTHELLNKQNRSGQEGMTDAWEISSVTNFSIHLQHVMNYVMRGTGLCSFKMQSCHSRMVLLAHWCRYWHGTPQEMMRLNDRRDTQQCLETQSSYLEQHFHTHACAQSIR